MGVFPSRALVAKAIALAAPLQLRYWLGDVHFGGRLARARQLQLARRPRRTEAACYGRNLSSKHARHVSSAELWHDEAEAYSPAARTFAWLHTPGMRAHACDIASEPAFVRPCKHTLR
jgi:hypothetical protein